MASAPEEGKGAEGATRLPALWAWLSVSAAALAGAGSLLGLLAPGRLYGQETSELLTAALAQDLVNLFLVSPLMLILAVCARRGSLKSGLCLIGFLAFTVYNYAIYAFSIHFGPLFLVWVAVLGLATFALAGSLTALNSPAVGARLGGAMVRLPGWFLIVVAALFSLLWLSEIVPDLMNGRSPAGAADWDVPTNPVHVLDLAFFLPATGAVGGLLLRGHRLGYVAAPGALIWLVLTSLPIVLTPFVAQARGEVPEWFIIVPIAALAVATSVILGRLLHAVDPPLSPGGNGT